jgi:hypothetical protein
MFAVDPKSSTSVKLVAQESIHVAVAKSRAAALKVR